MIDDNWTTVKRLMEEAEKENVEQPEMPAFLKEHFASVLDTLEEMVGKGIDLSDWQVVSDLKTLELALHQIPQNRIYSCDADIVIDEFEAFVERFYVILSLPKQNAETSFTERWIISRFRGLLSERDYLNLALSYLEDDILEEQAVLPSKMGRTRMKKLEQKKQRIEAEKEQWSQQIQEHLDTYLTVCKNLDENGSEMIRASIATVAEDLAQALSSEDMWQEAGKVWEQVIGLLAQDNIRIIQREGRLNWAKQRLQMIIEYSF